VTRIVRAILPVLLSWMTASGCARPCERLADAVCDGPGASEQVCREARASAERAGAAEQELCREALQILGSGETTGG
jgi:hypothetical protein